MSLVVRIYSFGYHVSGIPVDPTPNKGGFVFDCRCLPNPGRETAYKTLSGLDVEVQHYLKQFPVVQQFTETCAVLVRQAIHAYRERYFTGLMVAFGCTGGQHRSVYQAECLRQLLAQEPEVQLEVIHTERSRWPQK